MDRLRHKMGKIRNADALPTLSGMIGDFLAYAVNRSVKRVVVAELRAQRNTP